MTRRLWLIPLLLVCFSSFLQAKGDRKQFEVYDFSKGLDSYHNSYTLPNGFVQASNDVLFDGVSPVSKVQGYNVAWSSKQYASTGLWTYVDPTNTTWQISRDSDQITASNLAGTIVLISTVTATNLVGFAPAFGNAYFVDQTQGVYYWNGTSTTIVANSPKGSIMNSFHNRLWVTGAAVPNGNQLYGSKYYDGTTWTTGLNPTDPVQFSIGLQDNFDNVTALYVYLDTEYIFKHYAIYALYGFDQTSFQISQLTQECGCIDGASIQTFNGALEFVSLRGVESFNGYTCNRISDPVKNYVDPSTQRSFSQNSWVQQNQADWTAGTISPANTITLGSTLSIFPVLDVDQTSVDFGQGSFTNTSYQTDGVRLALNNLGSITNANFDGSFSGNWIVSGPKYSQQTSAVTGSCTITPQSGSDFLLGTNNNIVGHDATTLSIISTINNSVMASISVPQQTDCSWRELALTDTADTGKRFRVQIQGGSNSLITTDSYIWGGSLAFWYTGGASVAFCPGGGGNCPSIALDNILNGSSTVTSGSFTSRTFNTVRPSNYISFNQVINSESPGAVVYLQTSPDGVTWSNLNPTGDDTTFVNYLGKQYFQYVASFTVTTNGDALNSLKTVSFQVDPSSGVFTSQFHAVSGISHFGPFNAITDLTGGGNIQFSICTSSVALVGVSTCTAISANDQITVATAAFVSFIATFTVTSATNTAILSQVSINWYTGVNPNPMSSTVWDNRYWLSLTTTTTDTANDAVLVLSKSGSWSILDFHAGGFTQTRGLLYHSDSSATGNIYLDNQGWAANGNPINAFIKTKDLSLGDLSSDDYLYAIYPALLSGGNCSVTFQYNMDHDGNTYSLGSPMESEFANFSAVRLPFPIDSAHQDFGQSVNFTIGTNDNSCSWNFIGLEGLYKERPIN